MAQKQWYSGIYNDEFYEGVNPPAPKVAVPVPPVSQPAQASPAAQAIAAVDQQVLTYYNSISIYQTPQPITANCNAIFFYNIAPLVGGAPMIINGVSFAPLTGLAINGNLNELDVTNYTLSFGSGTPLAAVFKKNYNNS